MWTYEELSLWLKIWMALLAIFLAVQLAPRRMRFAKIAKRFVRRLAMRPWLCCALIVGLSLSLSAVLTAMRYPLPWTHDEFSYLLASDTFANGHVTNASHPHWQHFETFHVLSQPTYMSKYPPGNGLALGLGQWLTGHAIVGAWISLALAAAAVYYMFRAWLPPSWAAFGGLLITLHAPMLRAWGQSYWGGAVALLGGALVFGALKRIWDKPKIIDSCLLGLGLVILANTRPLEGFLASIPVAVVLAIWLFRKSPFRGSPLSFHTKLTYGIVPTVVIGVGGLFAMAAYNTAVTGDALTMPYALHDKNYSASSLAIWKSPPESPDYNHARMGRFYHEWGLQRQLSLREPGAYAVNLARKFRMLWDFAPLALGVCLFALPWVWRDPWMKFSIITIGAILLIETQMATSWMYPHYLAPIFALFFVVNVQCWRRLRLWKSTRRLGVIAGRAVLIFAILKLIPTIIDWQKPTRLHPRQYVQRQLAEHPGPHLVIVSYDPGYRIVDEWVYNDSDINRSPIVWARDMGQEKNAQLYQYFADRIIWRWHLVDDENMILRPFDPTISEIFSNQPTRP